MTTQEGGPDESGNSPPRSLEPFEARPPEQPPPGGLRDLYSRLKLKTEVDPIAIIALILAVIPYIPWLAYLISENGILTRLPKDTTFYKVDYQLSDGRSENIVRLTIPMSFKNNHPYSLAIVEDVDVLLKIGDSVKSEYYWEEFVDTKASSSDPKKLEFSNGKDAQPFSIAVSDVVSKEISFAPKQGTKSDPLEYAVTNEELVDLVSQGKSIEIEIIITASGKKYKYSIMPKISSKVSEYLNSKNWTVQEMVAVP